MAVENVALGLRLSEYHTGFRAYSQRVKETLPLLLSSDNFVFDQEIKAQAVCFGLRVGEIPVQTRYFGQAVVNVPADAGGALHAGGPSPSAADHTLAALGARAMPSPENHQAAAGPASSDGALLE